MSESKRPGDATNEPMSWLDGLAGRSGTGEAHAEGKRVRDALLPEPVADQPPWEEIERRAGLSSVQKAKPYRRKPSVGHEAANQRDWRPWLGVAAVLVLGTAITASMWPVKRGDDGHAAEMMRGVGASGSVEATWRVSDPEAAAKAFADELRGLGAQVTLQADGATIRLMISAPPVAFAAVNQRLSALETSVDAQGRLTLLISAP